MLRLAALTLTLLTITARAQTFTRPDNTTISPAQIDATVNHLIQEGHATGAAIALTSINPHQSNSLSTKLLTLIAPLKSLSS